VTCVECGKEAGRKRMVCPVICRSRRASRTSQRSSRVIDRKLAIIDAIKRNQANAKRWAVRRG